jgi:hypothetical protein
VRDCRRVCDPRANQDNYLQRALMAIHAHRGEVQRLATEGIASIERPGVFARFFMAVVQFAERLNLRYTKFGNLEANQ